MLKIMLGLMMSLMLSLGIAANASPQPLSSDKAFVLTTQVNPDNTITLQWNIAPGYYLYQDKFNFALSSGTPLKLEKINWPASNGEKKLNGKSIPIYSGIIKITVPLLETFQKPVTVVVNYQGCSFSGFCYPPVKKYLQVDLAQHVTMNAIAKPLLSDQEITQVIFAKNNIFLVLLSFLGLGLLLAFTPCVLPMIPILSGIIVGHKQKVSTARAFSLSLSYVMGMAITYAIAGMVVALLGSSIQAFFQKTWVIILFSGIFILLSLSLFGVYELRLPQRWNVQATHWSHRFQGGTYFSVFFMGCISTLIVSPCVSAPLVGVLAYIAQTGNAVLGASALLMLGIGMGIPLLIIGTSAGRWLPKAGYWMDLIKGLFGVLMLSVAIWMLSRVISGVFAMGLWSLLFIGTGVFIVIFYKRIHRGVMLLRIVGTIALVYGAILMTGAFLGYTHPLSPWGQWYAARSSQSALFTIIRNQQDIDAQLHKAKKEKKMVILDFYADWCVTCVIMDEQIFSREKVRDALSDVIKLRVDVTDNDTFDRQLMQKYHVIAPPTLLLFDKKGNELNSQRIIGEVSENQFLQILTKAKESQHAQ